MVRVFKNLGLSMFMALNGVGLNLIWFLGDFFTLQSKLLKVRKLLLRGVDQGWIEGVGVQGAVKCLKGYSGKFDLGIELGIGVYLYGGFILFIFILLTL